MRPLKRCLIALCCLSPAYGVDIVVREGETATAPITLTTVGMRALIEQGGALSTAGNALTLNGTNQVVLNDGSISTTDANATAVLITASDARITNNALLTGSGNGASGISATSDRHLLTNHGTIRMANASTMGIGVSSSSDTQIFNSGTLTTVGSNSLGISVFGSPNVVVTNSGTIDVQGVDAHGIDFSTGNTNGHIINAGTIRSAQSFALHLLSGQTVTLLRGSNLQGGVRIQNAPLDFRVESGLNLALTIDPALGGGFGALQISAPFAQLGNTLAVVDKTGLTLQADVAADLAATVLSSLYRFDRNPCGCGLWAQGVGSYRSRDEGHNTVGYDNWHGGLLVGYDLPLCTLFGGVISGTAEVDAQTQTADATTYLAGFTYEGCLCDTLAGVALTAGYVDWENTRVVMHNLAPNGTQKARASIDGLFLATEGSVVRPFCHMEARLTGRYTGLFLGDYNESGSATNLSIRNRAVDLLTTRLELATCVAGMVDPYVGILGRFQVGGNTVEGELLGTALTFSQGGPRNLGSLFFGFRGHQSVGCLNLYLNLEASFDTGSSSRLLGEGGLGWAF